LLVCLVWFAVAHRQDHTTLLVLALALLAAVCRMRRAGVQFARTLVLDFIELESGRL
jgi:hypothetical protein